MLTGEEHAALGTCEALGLRLLADAVDVVQREVQHGDLDETRERRGDDLAHEHGPGRYLHVMAEFEIFDEAESLGPEEGKMANQPLVVWICGTEGRSQVLTW